MKLDNPITLTPPSLTKQDGTKVDFPSITVSSIDYLLYDDINRRVALVYIRPCPKPLILWKDDAYTTVGDYTQAQVENRITELLGTNIQNSLQQLF